MVGCYKWRYWWGCWPGENDAGEDAGELVRLVRLLVWTGAGMNFLVWMRKLVRLLVRMLMRILVGCYKKENLVDHTFRFYKENKGVCFYYGQGVSQTWRPSFWFLDTCLAFENYYLIFSFSKNMFLPDRNHYFVKRGGVLEILFSLSSWMAFLMRFNMAVGYNKVARVKPPGEVKVIRLELLSGTYTWSTLSQWPSVAWMRGCDSLQYGAVHVCTEHRGQVCENHGDERRRVG
jgi:hypothetical protein